MTRSRLLKEIGSAEYTDWVVYFSSKPWSWDNLGWQIAHLLSGIANFFSGKATKTVSPKDVLLKFDFAGASDDVPITRDGLVSKLAFLRRAISK